MRPIHGASLFNRQLMKKLLIATSLMLTGIFTANAEVELIGCSYASSVPGQKSGLYRISTTSPTLTMISDKPQATGGGVYGKGKYYCQWYISFMGVEAWANMEFDAETWEMKGGTGARDTWAFDLAYDDSTDRIYGCFHESDENYEGQRLIFGWINASDYIADFAPIHPVSDVFVNMAGMDFDSQGRLWAISREGFLFTVDKETGEMSEGIDTGLVGYYDTSATIDRETDTMYYFLQLSGANSPGVTKDVTSLYKIDLATGDATWVYDLPGANGIQGLSIFHPLAPLTAPDVAKNLGVDFEGGSLSGKVNFTVSDKTYGGDDASGPMSYSIAYRLYDDEEAEYAQLARGVTTYGSEVSANVTLPGNNRYKFAVTLFNSEGEASVRAITDAYVGYDTPLSPSEVTAELTDEGIKVTWKAPSTSLHEGFMDKENLKYNVVRMPDEATVATGLEALEYVDALPATVGHVRYTYYVYADNNGMVSSAGKSNFVPVGPFTVPYECNFADQAEFDEYTVCPKVERPDFYYQWDWHIGLKAARMSNTILDDDDWLITPPITLEGMKTYELSLDMGNDDDKLESVFEVGVGTSATREGVEAKTLLPSTSIVSKAPAYETYTAVFTPEEDGDYHFGIHSITPERTFTILYVYAVRVTEKESSGVDFVGADSEKEVYYSLDGRVLNPELAKGIVIVRKGNKAEKRLIP